LSDLRPARGKSRAVFVPMFPDPISPIFIVTLVNSLVSACFSEKAPERPRRFASLLPAKFAYPSGDHRQRIPFGLFSIV
jgi:hypothetical protein